MAELCPFKDWTKVASCLFWAKILPFWPHFLRYGLKFFCLSVIIYIDTVGQTKLSILSHKIHKNGHIPKFHFAQVAITKKPTPPKFFNEFVRNFQNRCKYENFANFLIMADFWFMPQKEFEPKIQKKRFYFVDFRLKIFLGPRSKICHDYLLFANNGWPTFGPK